jgi:hypothetical protein
VLLVLKAWLKPIAEAFGGFLIAGFVLASPLLYIYMIYRIIVLKIL